MTRASVVPRPCFSIITGRTAWTSGWCGFSTRMVRGCCRMMGGWFPTSSCRPCRAEDLTDLWRRHADAVVLLCGRPDRGVRAADEPCVADRSGEHRKSRGVHDAGAGRVGVEKRWAGRRRSGYQPLPGDDPKQRQPDITLARTELGWEPRVPLEEGLDATIDYFRELLAEGESAVTR
jgi:hypothetical protein